MSKFDRREFVGLSAAGLVGAVAAKAANGAALSEPAAAAKFEEATVADLQKLMASGEMSAAEITEGYLRNIEQLDKRINSIIEVNPDAVAIAERLDKERKDGKVRGPLHGIPVVIKDNIDTADKMKTTAGSLALMNAPVPKQDAFIVQRLREAGAVILAKTNLSEWANFRDNDSISGWSGRGGQTRNPYALDRNPSGSSSGTGAAISANLAAVGIGTETDGSIVSPSSCCGLVGLKPTVGLISRAGIVPIAHSQDTAGPMARTVADAATLLGAMTGVDASDPETKTGEGRALADYREFLKPGGLRGTRVGVLRSERFGFNREKLDPILAKAVEIMKTEGAEVIDPVEVATQGQYGRPEYEVLLYEFKADLAAYLAARPGAPIRSVEDLIAFDTAHADREMPFFGQEILEE